MKKQIRKIEPSYEVQILYKRPLYSSMPGISTKYDAYNIMKDIIDANTIDHKEFFWVLLVNHSHRLLGYSEVGRGDNRSVIVNKKEIFQMVIKMNASGIILCHNHPSGNLEPSMRDVEITKEIQKMAEVFSISLLDHLIITSEGFMSMICLLYTSDAADD